MKLLNWKSVLMLGFGLLVVIRSDGTGCGITPGADEPAVRRDAGQVALAAAAALYEGVRTETLPNGLRIFLKPVPQAPVVSTMVAYKVGSADEDLDNTGLSHYLEHLMFKGTNKIMPGDIDHLTLRNGGANNAYTTEDMTVYHFDFAADRWEEALDIEADRMRNLQIDTKHEFQQEKGAVIEELQRDEDQPWDLEQKAILPILFGHTGPYGHPVIGQREHVRNATAAVIKAHYNKWYYPNNAALVICGGFDPDKALAKIKQLFGPLPKGDLPARKTAAEVIRKGPVHHEIASKFDVPRMVMGFNTVRSGEPAAYALEVVQAVLAGGKTGRLYKKLVDGAEVAASVDASSNTGRYPGWLEIQVELIKGKNPAQAENLVLAELESLRQEPVSEVELKRAKQGILAGAIMTRESVHELANSIARGVTINDLDYLKQYLPRIAAITAQDVQAAARSFLDPERRVVVWSLPGEKPGGVGRGAWGVERERSGWHAFAGSSGNSDPLAGTAKAWHPHARRRSPHSLRLEGPFSLTDAHKVTLDNGLILLLLENHRLPIVTAEAHVNNVRLLERAEQAGLATLTGRLLDEGTAQHTGAQIAEMIENVGGALSFSASGGGVRVLAPDRRLGLALLLECLTQSNFPKEAFAREQQRLLSLIDDAEQQPETKAQLVFEEKVYGNHPLGRPVQGRHKTVETLSPADCAAFHREVFVPNNTLLAVVGDFDSNKVIDEIKQMTAAWKKAAVRLPELPEVTRPDKFTQTILTMPGAVQLHFYMGQPGIRRANPDYYKLLVMDYVLGTGPGFTDRLSARLRDREGLAYTVSANITDSAGKEPGVFRCYIGTDPANFARVKATFLEELNRIRDTVPQAEEVEDAKKYLVGSLPFQVTTSPRVASLLLTIEEHQLGFNYFNDYRQAVSAVTPADVQAVARKYLDPNRMVLVAAGPLDAEGRVLEKVPAARPRPPK
jgi:zinc protease